MARPATRPSQSWRTFLANHVQQIMAADFFVVPTATYRLLFVLVILAHERRRIVHVPSPTIPRRCGRRNSCAMPFRGMRPRYLILDVGTRRVVHWNVTEHPTAAWT